MNVQTAIKGLGESLGMPDLALDSDNTCAFDFAEYKIHTEVRYVERANVFNLCAGVSTASGARRAELMRTLLLANLHLPDMGECHFALRGVEDEVVLCRTIDADSEVPGALRDAVQQLVAATQACRLRLSAV